MCLLHVTPIGITLYHCTSLDGPLARFLNVWFEGHVTSHYFYACMHVPLEGEEGIV